MEEKDRYENIFAQLRPKLEFPADDVDLKNVWQVYEPSFQTQILASEQNRQVYAEAFDFGDAPDPNTVESLRMMVLRLLLAGYNGGALDERIQLNDKIWIGQRIDVELPLTKILDLDVSERVVDSSLFLNRW